VKTPIYLVGQKDMAGFVCKHPFWLNINEVYKNVPDKKPSCG
jgi:D-xylose transport system substrate-binding protein